MTRRCSIAVAGALAAASIAAFATDMDHEGRIIATVETKGSGIAEVTCNDVGAWKFDVRASQDAGVMRLAVPSSGYAKVEFASR